MITQIAHGIQYLIFSLKRKKTFRLYTSLTIVIFILILVNNHLSKLNDQVRIHKQITNNNFKLDNDIKDFINGLQNNYSLYENGFPISSKLSNLENYMDYNIDIFSNSKDALDCSDTKYSSSVKISGSYDLPAKLSPIVDLIDQSIYGPFITYPSTEYSFQHVAKHWFRFGGSSVWLQELNIHFMVSRILYSPSGVKNKPLLSFLHVQIFDPDWKEFKNIKLSIPFNHKGDFKFIRFPKVLPIDFYIENDGFYYGPEDPRILLRKNKLGFEEPLIIFNMKSDVLNMKRAMHGYFPFTNKLIIFRINDQTPLSKEKNWTPFFPNKGNFNDEDKFVNFIYSITPLDILKCDLETGLCDFTFEKSTFPKIEDKIISEMRGGTNLVHLPIYPYLPIPANRQIWVGFARAHIESCGCGKNMYRPNLLVLVEDYDPDTDKYEYIVESISSYVDFNIDVPGWDIENIGDLSKCEGNSVLIPNSIAYWNVLEIEIDNDVYDQTKIEKNIIEIHEKLTKNDLKDIKFKDYLGLTVSSADTDVRIIHINGLLNYIMNIKSIFHKNGKTKEPGIDNVVCALESSKDYCYRYGQLYTIPQIGYLEE